MSGGKIIFLHGASSAGKSMIARALQNTIGEPFWHVSIDHLRDTGVLPSDRIRRGDFAWRDMRASFFDGFHRSLAAYAEAGNNLIVEHILDTRGWQAELGALLATRDMFFVAVHCPLEELVRREMARGDRGVGSAAKDFHTIHKSVTYDLELQTLDGPEANAAKIIAAWNTRGRRSAFFSPPPI